MKSLKHEDHPAALVRRAILRDDQRDDARGQGNESRAEMDDQGEPHHA